MDLQTSENVGEPDRPHRRNPLVLIADRNEDHAASLAILLQLHGYETEVADNGVDALALAQLKRPDIVLFEMNLPGLSGCCLAKVLSAPRTEKTPFLVAVTCFNSDHARRQTAEAGANMHLLKPVDPGVLLEVLGRVRRMMGLPIPA